MPKTKLRSLIPLVHVSSVTRSIAFYEKLGFTVEGRFTPPGSDEPSWASLMSGRAELMIADGRGGGLHPSDLKPVILYLYCADVKAMHEQLHAAGLDVGPIETPFYNSGGEFRVIDPDGYWIVIA